MKSRKKHQHKHQHARPFNGYEFMARIEKEIEREELFSTIPLANPVQEMIAIADAAFTFIRHSSNIDGKIKKAFGQLEKQFGFYRGLV